MQSSTSETERVSADELMRLPWFADEQREAVEWIAGHLSVRRIEAGDVIVQQGDPLEYMAVILEGELHFRPAGHSDIIVRSAGHIAGLLPFSRAKTWAGRGWAAQPTRVALLDGSLLHELVYRAPNLAQKLVSEMTDRARAFTRMEEGSNRLLALGKLAAGLAHELNNPASAAVRSSARLREVLTERRKYVLAMRGEVLSGQVRQVMTDLGEAINECSATPGAMDALERADLESDFADWLESVGAPTEVASDLVDAGIAIDQVRPLAALVEADTLSLGLRILVADHQILCLTRELEEACRRMSDLVQAVKSYSYMDQSPVAEVDVAQGIDVTLRMFQHQLKQGVQVSRQFAPELPRIRANGSALNQVWTNLIDNALYALERLPKENARTLTVRTCAEPGGILVEVADNGPGIPLDVQSRIFEPFFTTKSVGEGTGLGLDIVQRIVRSHKGSIRVESKPGRTVFQVRLPVEAG